MTRMLSGAAAVALSLGLASAAWAAQDPSVGGELNQCWGQIASQTAQLDTPDGTSGGGMGQHSRATKAADKNGGFANSNNGFGITFNELNAEGNHGRAGVGNASRGAPHFAEPGDGGNGTHAINNGTSLNGAGFANTLDPVTGQFRTVFPVPKEEQLRCSLDTP